MNRTVVSAALGRIRLVALACLILGSLLWSVPVYGKLWDFANCYAAGVASLHGLDPYRQADLVRLPYPRVEGPNPNPPIAIAAFRLFAGPDPMLAFRVWYAASLGLYVLALALLARRYSLLDRPFRIAWALALAGVWATLELGQVYMPLVLACAGAWLLLEDRRFAPAGLLIGVVVAIKPNLVVWPALLLLSGYALVAVVALVTVAVLSAAPAIIWGIGVYGSWLLSISSRADTTPVNASLIGLAGRLGLPAAGPLLASILLAGLAVWAARHHPDPLRCTAVGIAGALLASPLAWIGYSLLLLPGLVSRPWPKPLILAATLLLVPSAAVWMGGQLSSVHSVVLGAIYPVSLGLILYAGIAGPWETFARPADSPVR